MGRGVEVIRCVTDNSVLVQKSQIEDLTTHSQLIVNESQEALFYKEGQALDLFGAGRHALQTENLPILQRFFSHLFGGKTPFPCEIFFINRTTVLDVLWGTPSPIVLEDPLYGLVIRVRASGQTGIRVRDSRKFVVKVVGQLSELSVESVRRSVKGMLMTSLTTLLASTIVNEKVSILQISTMLDPLSLRVQEGLNEKLADLGLEAVHFSIGTVFADDADLARLREAKETAAARRVETAAEVDTEAYRLEKLSLARAEARATEGYTYQDERKYDVLEAAAANAGTSGSLVNAGVGLGVGLGVMGEIKNQTGAALAGGAAASGHCPRCGATVGADARFCPSCGEPQAPRGRVCPRCSATVGADARFCPSCGAPLAPAPRVCPTCGERVEPSCRFCPGCGQRLTEGTEGER